MEVWKPMYGFEKSHEISNYGTIRNTRGMVLKAHPDKRGYLRVKPNNVTQKVHRLVAQTFIPNPDNKPQVNHKDTNKQNNYADNLEWATNKENMEHAVESGGFKNNSGVAFMKKQRPVDQLDSDGNLIASYPSIQEAARSVGCNASNVYYAVSGRIKTCYGFKWRYQHE